MDGAQQKDNTAAKKGFTIIEVTLFLALTGLMLIGVLGGTYASIASQRYNDSLRSFAEFLRKIYAEVLSPESLGKGNSDEYAVYGKIMVFGLDRDQLEEKSTVYTATLIGKADPRAVTESTNFMDELKKVDAKLYCGQPISGITDNASSLSEYKMQWDANLVTAGDTGATNDIFRGTVIIARSPASGAMRAAYSQDTFPIDEGCSGSGNTFASTAFNNSITDPTNNYKTDEVLTFCVQSPQDSRVTRGIQLDLNSPSTSAINILTEGGGC